MIQPIQVLNVQHLRVQHNDVPQALDPVEDEGEYCQHDGVATVMMKLPTQGFA